MMATVPRPQTNIAYACARCGGQYARDGEGAWVCLLCARPFAPVVPLPYVEDADMRQSRGPKHGGVKL